MKDFVVIIEEVSQGSDDQGEKSAHFYSVTDVFEVEDILTGKGFHREAVSRTHQVWYRYGGFHNEQRAEILPAINHAKV